jgi:hypothetical protein
MMGLIWNAAYEYPKIRKNKAKEQEEIPNNILRCSMRFTLYHRTIQLTRISKKGIDTRIHFFMFPCPFYWLCSFI